MKQFICLSCVLCLAATVSFGGNAALFPTAPTQTSIGKTIQNSHDEGGGEHQKKKKKKKKKKKGNGSAPFQQGAGMSLFFAPGNAAEEDNSTKGFGGSYFPSLQLKSLGSNSLRLAVSPSVWFNIKSSRSLSNNSSGGFASYLLDVPVDLEFHLGDPSHGSGFGGHVGAGFGYNRMGASDAAANKAFGPHLSAGVRWNTFGQESVQKSVAHLDSTIDNQLFIKGVPHLTEHSR